MAFCRVVFEARASWQKLKREDLCKIGHAQGVHERGLRAASEATVFEAKSSGLRTLVKERRQVAIATFGSPMSPTDGVPTVSFNPKFRAHKKAHQTVVSNERWFTKGEPFLGKPFTVKKAVKRHSTLVSILSRAAKRAFKAANDEAAGAYHQLQAKLTPCRPHRRCGSAACPKCARAFQRAKVEAEQTAIAHLAKARPNKQLVFVTIVPRSMTYVPGQFCQIAVLKANRWLKDVLDRHGIRRVIVGSVDLGWEDRRGHKYLQLHWHLAMWTNNPEGLEAKLKAIFRRARKHERPVDVELATDLNFAGYMNKLIKLPRLLRCGRKVLPELSLVLDHIDLLDFLFLRRVRLSAQADGIRLRQIK